MNGSRPRILYVSSAWPHDQAHGGQLRALHIGRALKEIGDVTLLVVNSDPESAAVSKKTAEEFDMRTPVHPRLAPNRSVAKKLRWALDPHFLNVHGCTASVADRQRVLGTMREFDLIWVLNARTPNLLQVWQWPRAHLDLDDIPSASRRLTSSLTHNSIARWKAYTESAILRRRERSLGQRFVTLSVCSEADRTYLGSDRVHVIPNGFARPKTEPTRSLATQPPRIGFVGLYSHAPNLDGVRWFLKESWPQIRREVPGVRFRMVGKDTDGSLKPADPQVDALGWLPDPAEEIATWSAMVVPIRFGGGTRIKLADAFSRKCPVVATRVGSYGYQVTNRQQLLLADDSNGFAQACVELVNDTDAGRAMAENAWQDFLRYWTWEAVAPKVHRAAEDCLRRSTSLARGLN